MKSSFGLALLPAVAGLMIASAAGAGPPNPDLSTVPSCIPMSPNGGLTYRVTIVGVGGPTQGALVAIRFTDVGDTLVCWCNSIPGPRPHVFTQTTDANGEASFNLAGGGCIEFGSSGIPGDLPFAAEVFADAVKMAEIGVVSPDVVDPSGRKATGPMGWNPDGACAVSAGDAVYHTAPLASGQYDWCTDMNCDHAVTSADAVILTPFLAAAASCSGDAGP